MNNKSQRQIFAENLKRLIERRKIDQKELARAIGVSDQSVSNWVRGTNIQELIKYN